jgi:hypothetical protein
MVELNSVFAADGAGGRRGIRHAALFHPGRSVQLKVEELP